MPAQFSPNRERKLIYAWEDEIARLHRIEEAARAYYDGYIQDEAHELELCVDPKHHRAAQELRDALAITK